MHERTARVTTASNSVQQLSAGLFADSPVPKAAEELHVTHGAVSRQVKQLETALGVTLSAEQAAWAQAAEPGARGFVAERLPRAGPPARGGSHEMMEWITGLWESITLARVLWGLGLFVVSFTVSLLIVGMGLVVMLIVLAVLLPIIQLNQWVR